MPGQLANLIRQKYPGQYDDLDDAALEKAVLAKYPDYADLAQPEKPERSVGDFLTKQLPSSAGRLLKDTASGLVGMGKGALNVVAGAHGDQEARDKVLGFVKALPGIAAQIPGAIKNRYVDNLGETLYTDPVGVLADVSSVAGLGASARIPKIAGTLRKVEQATDPLRAITAPIAKGAQEAGNLVVRGTLRAPAAVREDFGGGRGVADAVLKNRVFSEASAQKKLTKSVSTADAMLADAQAAGTPGVLTLKVAQSVLGEPKKTAKLRTRLGVADASPELQDTAKKIVKNNPQEIPLTDAQTMKREAQQMAYEAGADNLTVKKAAEKAKAKALKQGIEERVPDVGPINQQSEELIGAQRAFSAAQDRPRMLTNTLAGLGMSGGAASGDPLLGILTAALVKGMDSPRAGAMAGIGMNEFGRGLNAESFRRAALLSRLLSTDEP